MIMEDKVMATYLFPNGMVATFGWNGEQIPELQEPYSVDLHKKITLRSDEKTQWNGFKPMELNEATKR